MAAITENNANDSPRWQVPALDKLIYRHRAMILHNLTPFISMMYGLGLLIGSGPSLSTILESRGGMSVELSAALFLLAGTLRFGRQPGTVSPILYIPGFFIWLFYTFMAIWSATVNGSTPAIIFMYSGIFMMELLLFIIEFYGGGEV